MNTYKFTIEVYVQDESEFDAAKHLSNEMGSIIDSDNKCVAFDYIGNGELMIEIGEVTT